MRYRAPKDSPVDYIPDNSILTFIKETFISKKGRRAMYKCKCGKELEILVYSVKSGNTKSCGCTKVAAIINAHTIHNLSNHPLFSIWYGIMERCYNPKNEAYRNYGAIGVKMCDEWKNGFQPFYDWAIENEWRKGLELDKDSIPKKLGIRPLLYSPETCCLLTHSQNNRHKRTNRVVEYKGESKTLIEWSEITGIKFATLWSRLNSGYSAEKTIETPLNKQYSTRKPKLTTSGT